MYYRVLFEREREQCAVRQVGVPICCRFAEKIVNTRYQCIARV